MRVVRDLSPSRKDVFYDLGCGYAFPCIWIAPNLKLAVGIENFWPRYKRALNNVEKSGLGNVRIIKKSFQTVSMKDATIIYSVILLSLKEYRKIQLETRRGAKLVLCYPPMYPIKSRKKDGYYFMDVPFSRVKDENEYARIISGRRSANIKDIHSLFSRSDSMSLKWQISHADYTWAKLNDARK
jgi:hypothetical protein